jgi:hypothetical protein
MITHAIAVLNGENPRKIMPSYSSMLAKKRSMLASAAKRQVELFNVPLNRLGTISQVQVEIQVTNVSQVDEYP